MQPAVTPPPDRIRRRGPRFLTILVLLAIAFGAGFVPQWLEARRLRATLETTTRDLRLATLHRELGLASHEAQRSNFASASEAASRFFADCATLAGSEPFEKEERTRVALSAYVAQRDEVMALLAAGDPTARDRLASLYLTMDSVLSRR